MRSARSTALTLALASAALVSASAWGGAHISDSVEIDDSTSSAIGTLSDARNSADTTQYIGCEIWAYSRNYQQSICAAQDANGVYRQCYTDDQKFIAIIGTLQGTAQLRFKWNANGQCKLIETHLASFFATKK